MSQTNGVSVLNYTKGDDKRESEDARLLAQALGEHGVLCAVHFPENKSDEENGT